MASSNLSNLRNLRLLLPLSLLLPLRWLLQLLWLWPLLFPEIRPVSAQSEKEALHQPEHEIHHPKPQRPRPHLAQRVGGARGALGRFMIQALVLADVVGAHRNQVVSASR